MVDKRFGAEIEFTADTAELEKLSAELENSKQEVAKLTKEYEQLKKQSDLVDTFKKQKTELEQVNEKTRQLKNQTQQLAVELSKTEKPTKAQAAQLERLRKQSKAAADSATKQAAELQKTRKALTDAGIDTKKLAANEIRLKRSLDETNQSLTRASVQHKKLARSIVESNEAAKLSARANNESSQSLKQLALNAAGAATAAGALVVGFTKSVSQSIALERALGSVRKTTEGTRQQFNQLRKDLEELSIASGTSAVDLASIAAAGGQLGVGIENLTEFTRLANVMSVAFAIAAEDAARSTATLANVFDRPIDSISGLADAINVLGNNTNATESQIVDALSRIGGTAKGFGLAAENAAALVDALIAMGEPPETAAVALSGMLVKLQNINVAGAKSKRALDSIGISASELADRIQADPQVALDGFLQTLSELDSRQASEVINQIFGEEQARKIVKLVGNLDQYKEALALVSDQSQVAGAAQREFDAALQSTDAQLNRAQQAFSSIGRDIGDFFIPAINIAAQGVADFIQSLKNGEEQITPFTKSISNITGAVTGLGTFLGETAAKIAIFTGGLDPANVDKFSTSTRSGKEQIKATGDEADKAATKLGGGFSTSLVVLSALGEKAKQAVIETGEALKILNVDAGAVSTGVRSSFADMIASYNQLSNELDNFSSISGEQSLKLIEQAKTAKELEAANFALFKSFQLNTLSAEDYNAAITESNRKLAELDPTTQKLRESLQKFGLDYNELAGQATASTNEQVRALGNLLEQTAKIPGATDQVVAAFTKQIRTQQDAASFLAEIDRLEKAQIITAQQAASARDRITASLGQYATIADKALVSVVAEVNSIEQLNTVLAEAKRRYDEGSISAQQFTAIEEEGTERRLALIAREDAAREQSGIRQRQLAAQQQQQARQQQQQQQQIASSTTANVKEFTGAGTEINRILGDIYKTVTDLGKPAEEQLARMSDGFRMMRDGGVNSFSALETAQYRLATAQDALRSSASGITEILAEQAIIAARVSIEYETQKQQLETLERRIQNAGDVSEQYINHLEGVKNSLTLLNESDLSGINSAIDAARNKVRQLADESRAARDELAGIGSSLQDELDRLNDDQEAIENRRYARQLRDIARLEAEGGAAAKREAEQSRKLAAELHRRKLQDIREEEAERRKRESTQDSSTDRRRNDRAQSNRSIDSSGRNINNDRAGNGNNRVSNVNVDTSALTTAIGQIASRPIEVQIDGRTIATALREIEGLSR